MLHTKSLRYLFGCEPRVVSLYRFVQRVRVCAVVASERVVIEFPRSIRTRVTRFAHTSTERPLRWILAHRALTMVTIWLILHDSIVTSLSISWQPEPT